MKTAPRINLRAVRESDLPFLLKLWNDPEVMRYAGFPKGRRWRKEDILRWQQRYCQDREGREKEEVQFIVETEKGTVLGESHLGVLPPRWKKWQYEMPKNKKTAMFDVKLSKKYWNKGYGTAATKAMVRYSFRETAVELLTVPPHRKNPAAKRVYEKAGFVPTGKFAWPGYEIWELSKKRFNALSRRRSSVA